MARIKKNDEDIKAEIICAAKELFRKYGFNKTTMEDIAKAVRKGKSTLYYYYKSKEEVFVDAIAIEGNSLLNKIEERVNSINSASEKFMNYFNAFVNETIKVTNLYSLLLDEMKETGLIMGQIEKLYLEKDLTIIRNILKYGIDRKEFLSINIDSIDSLAKLISVINRSLVSNFLLKNSIVEWKNNMQLTGEVLLRGIR